MTRASAILTAIQQELPECAAWGVVPATGGRVLASAPEPPSDSAKTIRLLAACAGDLFDPEHLLPQLLMGADTGDDSGPSREAMVRVPGNVGLMLLRPSSPSTVLILLLEASANLGMSWSLARVIAKQIEPDLCSITSSAERTDQWPTLHDLKHEEMLSHAWSTLVGS